MVVVTISGPPGSGTTTAGRLLAKRLGVEYVSTGELFRAMAKERGVALEEFGAYVDQHPEIDRELDRRQAERAKRGDVVLEGRLSGHMAQGVPGALKVYLRAPARIRSVRVAKRDGLSDEEAFKRVWEREGAEKARYMRVYGVDPDDPDVYDLILDSSKMSAEEIVAVILAEIGKPR